MGVDCLMAEREALLGQGLLDAFPKRQLLHTGILQLASFVGSFPSCAMAWIHFSGKWAGLGAIVGIQLHCLAL
jgi:hypothetical protein